jgi:DNA-directed RNA polymerase specialized sigma subunit
MENMKQNSERNQKLINYYLSPHSLSETGDKFGITPQRVQQILIDYKILRHKYQIVPQKEIA